MSNNSFIFPQIIGKSKAMKQIFTLIEKVSKSDSTVLISGESGTGKELIARSIHQNSSRAIKSFVAVNCGAIPADLLESELFGHEKGAFTNAISMRVGRFELADKGTLFLDEIGEMPQILQVKLLRVTQDKSFERLGGTKTISVDVRIISATNRNIEKDVKEGKFREDLFYRLNVIHIHVPPLRERKDDIPLLCEHFIKKHCSRMDRERIKLVPKVMDVFLTYDWPGNVRELENMIERLIVLSDSDVIELSDIPEKMFSTLTQHHLYNNDFDDKNPFVEGVDFEKNVNDFEKRLILHALQLHKGVKSHAANYLKIKRTTLIEKMKRLGMEAD